MGYLSNFIVYTLAMVGVMMLAVFVFKNATGNNLKGGSKYLKVIDTMSHGNVLRYTLETDNGIKLKSEVLFRSFRLYDFGQELYVTIEKKNCLEIDK